MAKFYTIQLDDIFLTEDGTESGDPVKLAVQGADALLYPSGVTIQTVGGAVNQLFSVSKPVEIRVLTHISKELWEDIVSLINNALGNSETINIVGTGDIGDFDVQAIPLLPKPFEAEGFRSGRITKPIFRFTTA